MSSSARVPTRRADAERNRDKLIAAARVAFSDDSVSEVSMAEIARRAGVGMATLYRNFPSRGELLAAVYVEEVNALVDAAPTLPGKTPGLRFTEWLHRFFAFYNAKRHVGSELFSHRDDAGPFLNAGRDRVLAVGEPLLADAQRSGEVRGDLSLPQILEMIIAIARISGGPDYLEPILQTALDGLHPRSK